VTKRICLTLLIWGVHWEAAGQSFEVGAAIGRGCTGDSSGFCSDQSGPMWSVHAGFWITKYLQIAVRFAALTLDDFSLSKPRDDRFSRGVTSAGRTIHSPDVLGTLVPGVTVDYSKSSIWCAPQRRRFQTRPCNKMSSGALSSTKRDQTLHNLGVNSLGCLQTDDSGPCRANSS
jgi:hypothetical protein